MRRLVGPGGTVLIVDERVPDTFAPNGDDVERVMYGFSVLHCLPVGMVDKPSVETGPSCGAPPSAATPNRPGSAGSTSPGRVRHLPFLSLDGVTLTASHSKNMTPGLFERNRIREKALTSLGMVRPAASWRNNSHVKCNRIATAHDALASARERNPVRKPAGRPAPFADRPRREGSDASPRFVVRQRHAGARHVCLDWSGSGRICAGFRVRPDGRNGPSSSCSTPTVASWV